jgi:hypothetical protein
MVDIIYLLEDELRKDLKALYFPIRKPADFAAAAKEREARISRVIRAGRI